MTEVSEFSGTDGSNLALGAINLSEGQTTVNQGNDIARALMGSIARQLGIVNVASANIASATTTDLSTMTGWYGSVTGTTTITGFGTVTAGQIRVVRFTGILTLTYNATSLILPGAANITTAANDVAMFVSLGSGNWICISYYRATGIPVGFAITSTDNAIVRFDGTTGKTQNSTVTVGDTGNIVTTGTITAGS